MGHRNHAGVELARRRVRPLRLVVLELAYDRERGGGRTVAHRGSSRRLFGGLGAAVVLPETRKTAATERRRWRRFSSNGASQLHLKVPAERENDGGPPGRQERSSRCRWPREWTGLGGDRVGLVVGEEESLRERREKRGESGKRGQRGWTRPEPYPLAVGGRRAVAVLTARARRPWRGRQREGERRGMGKWAWWSGWASPGK
jgi:hypothetical protein